MTERLQEVFDKLRTVVLSTATADGTWPVIMEGFCMKGIQKSLAVLIIPKKMPFAHSLQVKQIDPPERRLLASTPKSGSDQA